ncbi:MAG: deoxynucleoside kinase [Myxococcota bacterium]
MHPKPDPQPEAPPHHGGSSAHGDARLKRPMPGARHYIAVAGNIGVGKSSLVEFLCTRYNIVPYFEPNDANPYLEDFYDDMARYAFHSQVYFLAAKHRVHLQLEQHPGHTIQDRTIWEDAEIFAENLYQMNIMDERDYQTYRSLYNGIRDLLRPPDLMIYLHCNVRTIRRRIKRRGRAMEQDIPLKYLKRLQRLYDGWIARYDLSPIVTFQTDNLDYITDLVHCHDVLTTIERYLTD